MVKKQSRNDLTAENVREILDYSPESGELRWRTSHGKVHAGEIAGTVRKNGYRQIHIDYICHPEHRLVWLWVYGRWPIVEIDHIDRNKSNNRLANLREATPSQNQANRGCSRELGKGVRQSGRRYVARIKHSGKTIHLGSFPTPQEARIAYRNAAVSHFGEYARTS